MLGDQLDEASSAFDGFDPSQDLVWMAEVAEESTHVWSAKQRIAVFLSAMRHFAEALRSKSYPLIYTRLDDADNLGTLPLELARTIESLGPVAKARATSNRLRADSVRDAACLSASAPRRS